MLRTLQASISLIFHMLLKAQVNRTVPYCNELSWHKIDKNLGQRWWHDVLSGAEKRGWGEGKGRGRGRGLSIWFSSYISWPYTNGREGGSGTGQRPAASICDVAELQNLSLQFCRLRTERTLSQVGDWEKLSSARERYALDVKKEKLEEAAQKEQRKQDRAAKRAARKVAAGVRRLPEEPISRSTLTAASTAGSRYVHTPPRPTRDVVSEKM